jgi:hypothetical protein
MSDALDLMPTLAGRGPARASVAPRGVDVTSRAVRSWQIALALLPVAVVAVLGMIGADARWLAALGAWVVSHGVPDGVPYATAPTAGWADATVVGQVLFHAVDTVGGDRALVLAQAAAVGAAFWFLGRDMARQGATSGGALAVGLLVLVGGLPSFVIARAQLFSLALFPLLVLVLRSETRSPSRRIWLVLPIIAIWANLHGAVLTGVAVVAIYLLLGRARREPIVAGGVFVGAVIAACVTPVLWRTPHYYLGVLHNEAAHRGFGLWAPLSSGGWDILLVVAAVTLAAFAARRLASWELAATVALAGLSIHSARGGVWLLLFLAPPAAAGLTRAGLSPRLVRLAAAGLALIVVVGLARGPQPNRDGALVATAVERAGGGAILAEDKLAEEVALQGGRVWVANPIDAFRRRDQATYLDWLEGLPAGDRALREVRIVLVAQGSPAQRRMARTPRAVVVARSAAAVAYALHTRP